MPFATILGDDLLGLKVGRDLVKAPTIFPHSVDNGNPSPLFTVVSKFASVEVPAEGSLR